MAPALILAGGAVSMPGYGAAVRDRKFAPPWTPASLPSNVDYWDMSDTSKITQSGGAVSQVGGQLGLITLVQGTGANQPTTGTRTMNGHNVLDFDGSNDNLGATISAVAGNAHTFWAVFAPDSSDNFSRILSLATAGNPDYSGVDRIAAILRDGTNGNFGSYYNNAQRAKAAMSNAAHLVITQRNGDASDAWVDGGTSTQVTGLGTTAFGITTVTMGVNISDTSGLYNGVIAACGWCSTAVGSTDRANLHTWSQSFWGTP